ncbi:uncharacterized protein APUU_61465S [Aspergillus puulaauensis]|uniref:FMN-dependent dehydrogenase domain-containing protein n=1 Tax=Aspergillus puulaauensis TaxID=1220207 RepID=A0A7R7XVB8_9EURO|nr:uncharacterized protein APUU_61465S [Aspergillus puulaauensis]BCS28417.1 hypothetical protein APUU_61465S [Aspergillus puulaauensis]
MSETHGDYQKVIYTNGMHHNLRPGVTTDPRRLEAQARQTLNKKSFDYIRGGAGGKSTMARNRSAFDQWTLIPRMLTTVSVSALAPRVNPS